MIVVTTNRRAYHDYDILETLEAGIVLTGLEIKTIRNHRVSLAGSYAKFVKGELYWVGGEIEGQRFRKLLLTKRELHRLAGHLQPSFTLIPLKLYVKHGYAKLELGLARRKKAWDKRAIIKKRDVTRSGHL